jgi:hypothetical protein
MVRSEGNMSLRNPVTPPRVDPGTVRLVAQRLNHYSTPSPLTVLYHAEIIIKGYVNCLGIKYSVDTVSLRVYPDSD